MLRILKGVKLVSIIHNPCRRYIDPLQVIIMMFKQYKAPSPSSHPALTPFETLPVMSALKSICIGRLSMDELQAAIGSPWEFIHPYILGSLTISAEKCIQQAWSKSTLFSQNSKKYIDALRENISSRMEMTT